MSDSQLAAVVTRQFAVYDTWPLLFVYVFGGHVPVLAGFVMSGRRRGWFKRKTTQRKRELRAHASGVSRGLHRVSWEVFYIQMSVVALLLSLAQFFSLTNHDICSVDAAGVKSCKSIAGVMPLLYLFTMILTTVHIWFHLAHFGDFMASLVVVVVVFFLNVANLVLYIVEGSVAAAILDGFAMLFHMYEIAVTFAGNKSMKRMKKRNAAALPVRETPRAHGGALGRDDADYDEVSDFLAKNSAPRRPPPGRVPRKRDRRWDSDR